jgi:hypothetical protein
LVVALRYCNIPGEDVMDENQLVEDALKTLELMQRSFRGEPLGELSMAMRYQISPPILGMVTKDADDKLAKLRDLVTRDPAEFVDAADQVIKRRTRGKPLCAPFVFWHFNVFSVRGAHES